MNKLLCKDVDVVADGEGDGEDGFAGWRGRAGWRREA